MDAGRHRWRLVAPPGAATEAPEIDPSQRAVVEWNRGPAIVYAGPGTGKTTTLVESALARLTEGVPASSILLLTFGRDAAAEVRHRLALRVSGTEPPRVSTFHAFALELVMRAGEADQAPVRLLSGAEQERAIRDVIDGTLAEDRLRTRWPNDLMDAVRTRGFAKEVRAAFAAARALGVTGAELSEFGRRADNAAWQSIGPVLDEYLESQSAQGALDYAELMFNAVVALRLSTGTALVKDVQYVYVDEYQDTDPMQVALLLELSRGLRSLVAVGDPDQSIYGFRGADVRNMRDFTRDFESMALRHGMSAPHTFVLDQTRRYGSALRDYARAIFGDTGVPGLDATRSLQHRAPKSASRDTSVRAFGFDDAASEAAHIASEIRAIVQQRGAGWDEFAVLVRAAHVLPTIERALMRAAIPFETDIRDVRLVDEPAVRVLLRALEAVSGASVRVTPLQAHELLISPLCGLDPAVIRGLARALRGTRDIPSDEALAAALTSAHPAFELSPQQPGVEELESLRRLLHDAHSNVVSGATPHDVLWLLWSGTRWAERLRRQATDYASPLAHRDLDAVCELFDVADRAVQRRQGHAGVASFLYELQAQEVPSETLARRGFRGPAVRLLTAHRAKGLEWNHVFVAGVTESVWPDLRRRSALLDVDRLTSSGLQLPRSRQALFDEERRLFFVACTRARASLTVSGVAGETDHSPQLSRFLENPVVRPEHVEGRPSRIDSVHDLVATLRRVATSDASSGALRAAAIRRLQSVAALRDEADAPLFPEADWRAWWGVHELTTNDVPIDDPGEALYVRGSSLETLSNCSLRWLLEQKVHVQVTKSSALIFGSTIHALADAVVKGALPPDADELSAELRNAWTDAGYESKWQSERDFEEGVAAIGRFIAFHRDHADRPVSSEVEFNRVVDVQTPTGRVERLRMRGSIDRIEIIDGRGVVVFDYKTGRNQQSSADVENNAQLRYYQHAVQQGLLDETVHNLAGPEEYSPAGGALVHLRIPDGVRGKGPSHPKVQTQSALHDASDWPTAVLGAGLDVVREESFAATLGKHCEYCPMKPICPLQPEGRQT